MNDRERFLNLMFYRPVDRLPVMAVEPHVEGPALARWRREGLPADRQPGEFLGIHGVYDGVPLHCGPVPGFESRRLSESADEYVETDYLGATVRHLKEAPGMYYGYIDHPVKTRADWEEYKRRFDPGSPERTPANLEQIIASLNNSDRPVFLAPFPFFFRLGFYLMGMERFMTAFYDDPDLMHDMFSFYGEFLLTLIRPLLGRVQIDGLILTEDLAYKNGPHLSPKIYEEFWLPYQNPIVREVKRHGTGIVCLWTAGNIEVLLPMLMDNGINCIWCLERGSGMDPVAIRKKYGRSLLLGGGIPKEAMIEGPAAIDREIARLLPLIREGGYLPALDDVVPPEVPFDTYRYFVDALRAVVP